MSTGAVASPATSLLSFSKDRLYVIANVVYGDATYAPEGDDWKVSSQRTKAELLAESFNAYSSLARSAFR